MIQPRTWFFLLVSTVLLIFCESAPPQENDQDLDRLIDEVFEKPSTSGGLDGLIDNVFGPRTTTTQRNLNQDCLCVPYYLCNANNSILDDGTGIIDIRVKPTECDGALDVCCSPPQVLPDEGKITPKPKVRLGCGQRHESGVGFRITGNQDNEAQFGEFPWMMAILAYKPVGTNGENLRVYQCGGALIHPQALLTAAHCVKGKQPSDMKVRAGEWDTQSKKEIFPHQDRLVTKVITHPQYNAGSLIYDFAILIFDSPMELTENVDLVCLPEQNSVFDYSRCFASGWGKDVFGREGLYQVILKKLELPIVPSPICQESLRTTRLGPFFRLHETLICAGGEPGKDTCQGDGGSPLVCPLKNEPQRYVQAGIVAYGIGCGENGIPGVYANVAKVKYWIDEIMRNNNLDTSGYTYNAN